MQYFSRHSTFTGTVATFMCLLLLLNLTTALPQDSTVSVGLLSFPGEPSNVGKGGVCFKGWDQRSFQGNWVEACCFYSCCILFQDLLNYRLFSAKATDSKRGAGGMTLWESTDCSGDRGTDSLWVDFEGWGDLGINPPYYSMSLWARIGPYSRHPVLLDAAGWYST